MKCKREMKESRRRKTNMGLQDSRPTGESGLKTVEKQWVKFLHTSKYKLQCLHKLQLWNNKLFKEYNQELTGWPTKTITQLFQP